MKVEVLLVILLQYLCVVHGVIPSVGETRTQRELLVRKFLKKKEGAIKLVGGSGNHEGKFWMDNVECTGKEPELIGCRFDGWGHSDCEANEAAGVVCKIPPAPPSAKNLTRTVVRPKYRIKSGHSLQMRLVGGRFHGEGRVEHFHG
uniref:Putative secreted protein n=1 Tax=Lutzomyia longipalpis TaxID=7200 RepID=A0A1B0CT79_LUTLO